MQTIITNMLKKFDTKPFLFIGSGLSIRYLKLENWEELLRKFARRISNNEYAYEIYRQKAEKSELLNGLYPKIAELIEYDFNNKWFEDNSFRKAEEYFKDEIKNGTSPFKAEIAYYIKENSRLIEAEYEEEVGLFSKLAERSIDGVITTNYDSFIETHLIELHKFIGQQELIFSHLDNIGEIYKIHGCITKPSSIIINKKDYIEFEKKSKYLAAKILTIFMEHPIIFIGYSINDSNIQGILKSIVECLSADKLSVLKDRLIFVEWVNDKSLEGMTTCIKSFDNGQLIMTNIKLNDFKQLYNAILSIKSKYNTRVLRCLKRDIYNLVLTSNPSEKIKVVGMEDAKSEEVEVVIGVGVLSELGTKGYNNIKAEELYEDVVLNNRNFDFEKIVQYTLPNLLPNNSGSLPMYKYIRNMDKKELPVEIINKMNNTYDEFLNRTIRKNREGGGIKVRSIDGIVKQYKSFQRIIYKLTYLYEDEINLEKLEILLHRLFNEQKDIWKVNYVSEIKRVIRIYDWMKYVKNNKELD